MLEKLLNLLYSTQITRNLARARKELSQISDKRYYEKLVMPRLDAA